MNDEMKGNILYEIGFEGQVSEREDCENCGIELTVKNYRCSSVRCLITECL